ncbi:hypothetical protein ACHAWX_001694 [Stephanocyclus meneghinianus]
MSVESTTNTNAEEVNSTAIENKDMAVVESVTAEEVAAAEVPEVVASVDEGDVPAAPVEEPAAEEPATETEEAPETADATENENAAEEIASEIENATETEDAIEPEPVNATGEEVAEDKKRDAPEDPAEGEESPKQKLKTDLEPTVVGEASAAVEAVQQ